MNCLRSICGLRRIDRISNVEIRKCGRKVSVVEKMDQGVMIWCRYVEKWEMIDWLKEFMIQK